jgi:predicted nucleotidyltransferase
MNDLRDIVLKDWEKEKMSYEDDYYLPEGHPSAKYQRQKREKIIKAVTKYLKLDSPPPFRFLGLNPSKYILQLVRSKEGKPVETVKKIDQRIQQVVGAATDYDKMIFDLNGVIKRLVYTDRLIKTEGLFEFAIYDQWTALFDFSVSDPLIFGRTAEKEMHGGGYYCFAPLNFPLSHLESMIEMEYLGRTTDNVYLDLIQTDAMLKIMDGIRYTKEALDNLRIMLLLSKDKEETGIEIIEKLNQNKNLTKKMQSIGHFGAVVQGLSKFKSDTDISLVYLPLKSHSFVHLVNFETDKHDKALDALFSFANTLQNI